MKSCNQWSEELMGVCSPQAIKQVQQDAMIYAAEIAKQALTEEGKPDSGLAAQCAILDSLNTF